jgi:hypothetical protein
VTGKNNLLKQDLNVERLRAEESNQVLKMAKAKMDDLMSKNEVYLHNASIDKALWKRRAADWGVEGTG